jgi:hypothetical protein
MISRYIFFTCFAILCILFFDMCKSSLKATIGGLDRPSIKKFTNLYVNNLKDDIYFSHALLFCAFCFCRYVGKFIKKNDRIGSSADQKFTNLYVNNLEDDVTEELLAEKFSKFGKIFNVAIMRDESGHPRGFGFVNFEDPDDAKTAMEQMNGLQIGNSIGSLYLY